MLVEPVLDAWGRRCRRSVGSRHVPVIARIVNRRVNFSGYQSLRSHQEQLSSARAGQTVERGVIDRLEAE